MQTYCIVGPTASGKSAMALEIAEKIGGEIVSADSMQLYRTLDIGCAKPTKEEQRRVPHHLIDVLDIHEPCDIFRFLQLAEKALEDIRARGKVPVIAGGTGFYVKALLRGLDDLPGDRALREELEAEYAGEDGFSRLRERMKILDPGAFAKLSDCRRKLLRALEVRLVSGRSILDFQNGPRPLRFPVRAWSLVWPPELLRERIAQRTHAMLNAGWIDEAERTIAAGLLHTPTAHQALGYRLIGEHLAGNLSRAELEEKIIIATAQFARRQRTWFRHQHPEAAVLEMPQ